MEKRVDNKQEENKSNLNLENRRKLLKKLRNRD